MKHVIYINAAEDKQGGWLKFNSIKKNGEEYVITKDQKVVKKKSQLPSDEPLMLHITPENNYTFNYDDSKEGDGRNDQRALMASLIPYHHQITAEDFEYIDGEGRKSKNNPNAGSAMLFVMEDIALNDSRNHKALAYIRAAYNKVWDMSYREKIDCLYNYINTATVQGKIMGHKQATIRLLEPAFGAILSRAPYLNTGMSIIEHFVDHYKVADEGQVLRTTILKGKLINDNDGKKLIILNGSAHLFGGQVIGASIDEAMAWFNGNPEKKKYLYSVVSKNDKLDSDDLDAAGEKTEKLEPKKSNGKAELYDLARKLKIRSVHLYKDPSKLKEAVAEAEKVWQDVDRVGIRDTIERSSAKLFVDDIKKLIEEKEKELQEA